MTDSNSLKCLKYNVSKKLNYNHPGLEVLLEVEQNFGNLEKQPKCSIRPDILPIALGEKKNVEQFRLVYQATLLFELLILNK